MSIQARAFGRRLPWTALVPFADTLNHINVQTKYDFSIKETLLTSAFWMLILGTGARSFAMTSMVVHQVVYLTAVRDIPLVQASVVVIAILVILINLITDIIYAKLDPRIRLS